MLIFAPEELTTEETGDKKMRSIPLESSFQDRKMNERIIRIRRVA